jgi:ribosomal protein S18 acetylase RimI-like enzyme
MEKASQEPSRVSQVTRIEANLFALFSLLRGWPQLEVHDDPDLLWSISDIPFPLFNSLLRANLPPSGADDAIEEAIGRCRSRHVPMLWWTGPATRPDDLETRLAAKDFHGEEARGMAVLMGALPKNPPMPGGLVVEQVTDLKALTQWCKVLCAGFEMPEFAGEAFFDLSRSLGLGSDLPLRNYLGWLGGEPVATSSLFLGGGAAGIYNVATLPGARRRGIGSAMTSTPLHKASAEGYQVAILHSSEMGVGVYRNVGFEERCRIGQFVWTG